MDSNRVKIDFLTAGCNNETGIFDECEGYILYASGNNVLVSRIAEVRPVTCALPQAPKGRVHSCQWVVRLANNQMGALVAAGDGLLRLYRCSNDPLTYTDWSVELEWNLGAAVTLASFVPFGASGEILVAAATVKGDIHYITPLGSKQLIRSYAPKKITALSIGLLPNSRVPFILAALSDSTIRCIIGSEEVLSISGHQNWITSLQVRTELNLNSVSVLSASLDKTIRVWKIKESLQEQQEKGISGLMELVPQKNSFPAEGKTFTFAADSLALGHEKAVFFARFVGDGGCEQILSGSADRSLILWNRGFGGAWRTALQIGDLNGSLGTIGADHTFAFYGGSIFKEEWIVAAASTGSILFWKKSESGSSDWIPQIPITGHVDRVESITWAPAQSQANFLVSTSKDQTTRIFATNSSGNYREIARPQIHGYDLKCLALSASPRGAMNVFELISGADEKVLRVFNAPKQFYHKLGVPCDELTLEAAELPALGLSNKTTRTSTDETTETETTTTEAVHVSPGPESEGDLVRNSLWPEMDKLYGHNQEISAVALSPNGKFLASAAKSHLAADAALRLWTRSDSSVETAKWLPSAVVPAHALTVPCLVFSPDSLKLLSVSRDRNFCLINSETGDILVKQEAHARMIFTADWIDDGSLVTGSRDKTVKYWKLHGDSVVAVSLAQVLNFENGVTALATFNKSILAVGDELGNIFLFQLTPETFIWAPLDISISGGGGVGPADSITALKWNESVVKTAMELAVASADNSIRILSFYL